MEASPSGPSRLRMPEYRGGRVSCTRDMFRHTELEALTPSIRRSSMGSVPQTAGHIRVAVRVRPLPPGEDGIIEVANSGAIAIRKDAATGGNEFLRSQQGRVEERSFDRVFGPESSQKDVFAWSCEPVLSEAMLEARSATVFVYGATGAGKTHTMFGGNVADQQGIIFRAIPEVFRLAAEYQASDSDSQLEIKVSFLEIYNEVVRDLLQEGGQPGQCRVLEDERRGVVKVANLVEAHVKSADEALWYLRSGMQARTVEATAANSQSSRAHAVFTLSVEKVKLAPVSTGRGGKLFSGLHNTEVRQLHSKISLIDLAGSERASFTQNTGNALKDGARINQSLLALANCIDALTVQRRDHTSTPRKKPPYRDSKLTLMLKGSLTGDGMVAMIANVHPGRSHFEDSNNTLEYAKRAATVRNTTARRTSKITPLSIAVEDISPKVQDNSESPVTKDHVAETAFPDSSSSNSQPAANREGDGERKHFAASTKMKQPSSAGDSAPETACPEECWSEISMGSGGVESQEEIARGPPSSCSSRTTGGEVFAEEAEAEDAEADGRSDDVLRLALGHEGVVATASSSVESEEQAADLSVALKLIAKLQADKVQLDRRLKSVTRERDLLLRERATLEEENCRYRTAELEKDQQLLCLLTRIPTPQQQPACCGASELEKQQQ